MFCTNFYGSKNQICPCESPKLPKPVSINLIAEHLSARIVQCGHVCHTLIACGQEAMQYCW